MFRVKYDGQWDDDVVDCDKFASDDGWLWFTKGDEFVVAIKEFNVLSVTFEKGGER